MSQQTIGLGTVANDGTGDDMRVAFDKVNDNFTEIYTELGGTSLSNISFSGNTISSDDTDGNIILAPNGTGDVVIGAMTFDGNTFTTTSGAINITPFAGSAIVLDGTISVDAGVVTGATSITSTAFVGDVTGNASGTAATVTGAAQAAITSLGTLTVLTVDNIGIDANTISSSSGDVNITPFAGSAIVLDATISIDAGVVTGATSITSTAFVGALSGNADTVTVADAAADASTFLMLATDATGSLAPATDAGLSYDASTNILTVAGSVAADVTGNVTGNATGTAATVTGAAQASITSVGTLTGVTMSGSIMKSVTDGISAAGATQGAATALTTDINRVDTSVVTSADGVKLPTAVAGMEVIIVNRGGATVEVWPFSGDNIDAIGVDSADTNVIADGGVRRYVALDTTNWYTA